jgi:hypothetical protein
MAQGISPSRRKILPAKIIRQPEARQRPASFALRPLSKARAIAGLPKRCRASHRRVFCARFARGQIAKASSDFAKRDQARSGMGDRTLSSALMHILDSQPWTKTASSVKCRRSAGQVGHIPTNLRRDLMRKVTLTLAIALLFAGSAVLTADAQTSRGANNIAGAAQNFTPIEPAACRGWGPYCRPGFVRTCGRFRCWCRPCW